MQKQEKKASADVFDVAAHSHMIMNTFSSATEAKTPRF